MRTTFGFVASLLALSMSSTVAWAGPIENLAPGEWYRVPSSRLDAVDPCPAHNCSYSGATGVGGVIDAWSGGAFDIARDRLLVWGGGHGDYAGNEIYAFDLDTLQWERLTEPSNPVSADTPYAPDGKPTSRHTYNYVQYVPALDAMCSFGGAAFYQSGQSGTSHTDCYSFGASAWKKYADSIFSGIGAITAVDGATGLVWGKGTGYSPSTDVATRLGVFDPAANTFAPRDSGNADLSYAYNLTAAIDSKRHLMVAIGAGDAIVWNLSGSGNVTRTPLNASGAKEIQQANAPGLAYDSKSDRIIAWSGGASVYALDTSTRVWARHDPAPSNTVTPTAAAQWGTFGRFRYSPQKNVFVVVNAVDEDVYVYRLSAGPGVTIPPPPPPPPGSDGGVSASDGGAGGGAAADGGPPVGATDASAGGAGGVGGAGAGATNGASDAGGSSHGGAAPVSPSGTVEVGCAIGHAPRRDVAFAVVIAALIGWRHRRHRSGRGVGER